MNTLVYRIQSAFADVPYPGDDNLTDSFGDEADALRVDFRGRIDWTLLDTEFLNQAPEGWGTALSFFSAAALHFYLPAYLIADIEGRLDIGDATSRLCSFLVSPMNTKRLAKVYGGGTLGEHARNEFERFNAVQVSSIVAYLLWKLDRDGDNPTIEQALENYWLVREAELESGKWE